METLESEELKICRHLIQTRLPQASMCTVSVAHRQKCHTGPDPLLSSAESMEDSAGAGKPTGG